MKSPKNASKDDGNISGLIMWRVAQILKEDINYKSF